MFREPVRLRKIFEEQENGRQHDLPVLAATVTGLEGTAGKAERLCHSSAYEADGPVCLAATVPSPGRGEQPVSVLDIDRHTNVFAVVKHEIFPLAVERADDDIANVYFGSIQYPKHDEVVILGPYNGFAMVFVHQFYMTLDHVQVSRKIGKALSTDEERGLVSPEAQDGIKGKTPGLLNGSFAA